MINLLAVMFTLVGYLSGYSMWPTIRTIEIRQEWGQLSENISNYDMMISVPNCDLIGHEGTMYVGDEEYSVLVFDCAGEFGHQWMLNNAIAAELGYFSWMEHTDLVGTGVIVKIEIH